MPITLPFGDLAADAAHAGLFGGNVLAPRAKMTGEGSYASAVDGLGITGLRYPGGSLTEYCFDISDPNATSAVDARTGETVDFIPLSDFMAYAGAGDHSVTVVLPTRDQFGSTRDALGHRSPEIDETTLRGFVRDLVSGVHGDAQVQALELGNEYWGSGECDAVEYGRLASRMATVIRDELDAVERDLGIDTSPTRILVQGGTNHGSSRLSADYAGWDPEDVFADLAERYPEADFDRDCIYPSGGVNWAAVNDTLVRMGFDTPEASDAIDGVIAHVYSRGDDYSRQFALDCIHSGWLDEEGFADLEIHVTEWNMGMNALDPAEASGGLAQAHEMLELIETFMDQGVDQAHVWPLIQNTTNALSTGQSYDAPNPAGGMFSMMSKALPGKRMIDLAPGDADETELTTSGLDIHAFAAPDEMVLYAVSTATAPIDRELELGALLETCGEIEISVLGAVQGEGRQALARITTATRSGEDISVDISLAPGEIMQILLRDIVPTREFAARLEGMADNIGDGPTDPLPDLLAVLPIPPAPQLPRIDDAEPDDPDRRDDAREDDEKEAGGDWGGLSAAMALLPLLALFGI